jgi:predicted transcriptional regulator
VARKTRLTPVEWEIMEAIWAQKSAPSVREVLEHAFPKGEKAYTTVQTIMNTLVRKGVLRCRKTGLVNFYQPTRTRDTMVKTEMRSMVSRIFGGSVPALANSLLSLDKLELAEIEQLKILLDEKEREIKGDK